MSIEDLIAIFVNILLPLILIYELAWYTAESIQSTLPLLVEHSVNLAAYGSIP